MRVEKVQKANKTKYYGKQSQFIVVDEWLTDKDNEFQKILDKAKEKILNGNG